LIVKRLEPLEISIRHVPSAIRNVSRNPTAGVGIASSPAGHALAPVGGLAILGMKML